MTADIGFAIFWLLVLVAFWVFFPLWKKRNLKHYKYEVKLVTGETFTATKTYTNWWSDNPWTNYYTIEKSTSFASGITVIIPVRNTAYRAVIDDRKRS